MAIKKRMKDGSIVNVTIENKDETIRRLADLLKEVTETLSEVLGYDKAVAAASTYSCYG